MGLRKNAWWETEVKALIEHYDSPSQVLDYMFPRHSLSSINRKIARLREAGLIGYKSASTKKESRARRYAVNNKDAPELINDKTIPEKKAKKPVGKKKTTA